VTVRYLGIDVGGTYSKLAVLEVAGDPDPPGDHPGGPPDPPALVAAATIPTGPGGEPDDATGRIVLFPNLPPAWTGAAFREPLADRLGLPVALINDARAFTLAESRMGAAAGCPTVVCVTLGTGVGGGVVVDGRLRFGPSGRAGELGHQVIEVDGPPCGCGNRGCVEAFAAGAALCRLGGRATPEAVFAAAAAGDGRAAGAVQAVIGRLAVGIANLVTVLWPERVVVGGGVAAAGDRLFGPLRAAVAAAAPLVDPAAYEIVPAALGPGAGAIGAALWAGEATDGQPAQGAVCTTSITYRSAT
jgi:glucokinase